MGNAVRMMRSWSGTYRVAGVDGEGVRALGRLAGQVLLVLFLGYLGSVAWGVLQELRAVKLHEFSAVLRIVSVGDAILIWFGYTLARDAIRSLGRQRH